MIGPELARMMNTLYGFAGEGGQIVCCVCAEKLDVRDEHGLTREGADGGWRPVSGVDYFNAGQDPDEDRECSECGGAEEGHKGEMPCSEAEFVLRHVCGECGEALTDGKEE
jgi:hypothetical protein